MSNKVLLIVTAIVCGLILFIGLGVYLWKFSGAQLSNDPVKWGVYGDYASWIFTAINTLFLSLLSFVLYRSQEQREKFEANYLEADQKPIVIFYVDLASRTWHIRNIGKGAALNIIVADNLGGVGKWENIYKCYSLGPGEKYPIIWKQNFAQLLAIYNDIFSDKIFTSICLGDETTINHYGLTDPSLPKWILETKAHATRRP